MQKKAKNLVFLIIILGGFFFLLLNKTILEQFKNVRLPEIFLAFAASLMGILFFSLGFKYLVKIFDVDLSFKEWFGLTICNSMFNYYIPARGGTVAKAIYLKKQYGFKYSFYITLVAWSFMLCVALTALIGLVTVLYLSISRREFSLPLFVFFISVLAVSSLLMYGSKFLIRLPLRFKAQKLSQFLQNMSFGMAFFSKNIKLTLKASLFLILHVFIMAVRLHCCFKALDIPVYFPEIIIVRTLTEFSLFISLIPGSLGIKEGMVIFSAGLFGIPVQSAVAAALLDRAVAMILIFVFGFVFSRILLGKLEITKLEKIKDKSLLQTPKKKFLRK